MKGLEQQKEFGKFDSTILADYYGALATKPLLQALRHQESHVRSNATWALVHLGQTNMESRPMLAEALKDSDPRVREAITLILSNMGVAAKYAIPELSQALNDENEDVCLGAAVAIAIIDPSVDKAVIVLAHYLDDRRSNYRRRAAQSLSFFGSRAKVALPKLIPMLTSDSDSDVRLFVGGVIGKIGPEAKDAVPALIHALKDNNRGVRLNATYALGEIGSASKDAVPVLIDNLNTSDTQGKDITIQTLKKINTPDAKVAVQNLK